MMEDQEKKHYDGLMDRTCPICGRNFIPAPFHVYRVNNVRVCTYSCQLKGERTGAKPKNEVHIKPIDVFTLEGKYLRSFPHSTAASAALNIRSESIRKCCRRQQKSAGGFVFKYREQKEEEEP